MVDIARIQIEADSRSVRTAGKDLNSLDKSGRTAQAGMNLLRTATIALGGALSVRQVVRYADAWQNATNQLRTVQKETESLSATQKTLLGIANETRSGYESTANLYTRLSRATENLNLNQGELVDLTSTINKSFAVSGATATEAANAITQLSQGLAAGALRGEEFNSVSEQSPILMQAIADNLRMTRGELRDFAAEGGITAEIVVESLQKASGEIDKTFGGMTATVGQATTVFGNSMLGAVGNIDQATGASGALASGIIEASEAITAFSVAIEEGKFEWYTDWMYNATFLTRGFFSLVGKGLDVVFDFSDATQTAAERLENFVGPMQGFGETASGFVGPMRDVSTAVREQTGSLVINIEAMDAFTASLKRAAVESERAKKRIADQITELKKQEIALVLGAREQAIYTAVMAAGTEATSEDIIEIARRTGAIYDQQRATEVWTDITKNGAAQRSRAEAEAARASEQNWQRTHEFVTTTILDIADNGGSAFERLGDVAVATAKRIAAEWLALKAMNLFGITPPAGMGGGGVAGTAGSMATSSVLGGLGSAVSAGYAGGGGVTGAILGNGTAGSGLVGAAGSAWGSITSAAAAIPVWGWAALGTAAVAKILEKDPTYSGNAGLLINDAPGASSDRKFRVDPFASGFAPQGFARRQDQGAASAVIDEFRSLDAALTEIASAAGLMVDFSNNPFAGLSEKGQGNGVFLGESYEDGMATGATLASQLDMFAKQWITALGDQVTADQREKLMSAASASDLVSRAAEIMASVEAEQNKALTSMEQAQKSAALSVVAAYDSGLSELDSVERAFRQFEQYAERGLTSSHIAEFTGLLQSEIDAVLDRGRAAMGGASGGKESDAPYGGYSFFDSNQRRKLLGLDGSHANGLNRVPFDGYRAELHAGERVLTKSDTDKMDSMQGQVAGISGKMEQLTMQVALYAKRTNEILDGWDKVGLPRERPLTA